MPDTLTPAYHSKEALPADSMTSSLYSIRCGTCDHEYVGQTQRARNVRTKVHQDRLGHSHKSAVAEHVHEVSPHMRSTGKALKSSTEPRKGWKEKPGKRSAFRRGNLRWTQTRELRKALSGTLFCEVYLSSCFLRECDTLLLLSVV